ncbi:Rne/Rng family ribonuclease [Brevibacillus migulae]|uniref:Rne/Rng family ribonuclease n=1 Tax=Brevibacillus migulae TaxID=1644114 RepID=UPI00106DE428|nr:Rne/Rng family ribonuclease [Brevibacillus migulae]
MKQILIQVDEKQIRLAQREAGRLIAIRVETIESKEKAGDIYRGRVRDVLPGMQAAFVDIGLEKNAYLSADDIVGAKDHKNAGRSGKINELIHEGEALLVQIVKESTGTKAARVTTEISLQGRYLVYLPAGKQISVSRKITDPADRERLQALIQPHLAEEEGAIIRTEAAHADERQLLAEITYLRSRWQEALDVETKRKTPALILEEGELLGRYVREAFQAQASEIVIDHANSYHRVKRFVEQLYPEYLERLHFYQESQPLFQRFGVDAQLDQLLARQVPLDNGGFLVFDRTEAMTVIDVNSGKFTGQGGAQWEDTIVRMNVEAAAEIARQLRLRDIGGIVMIDFIDMKLPENQEKVLERLRRELGKDPTPTRLAGFTRLGLVELTRKKERKNIAEILTKSCPSCAGSGRVYTEEEVARRFKEEVRGLIRNQEAEAIVAVLPPAVHAVLQQILNGDSFAHVAILAKNDPTLRPDEYRIMYAGKREEANRLYQLNSSREFLT